MTTKLFFSNAPENTYKGPSMDPDVFYLGMKSSYLYLTLMHQIQKLKIQIKMSNIPTEDWENRRALVQAQLVRQWRHQRSI